MARLRIALGLLSFSGVLYEIAMLRLASVLLYAAVTPLVVAGCLAALGLGAALDARGRVAPAAAVAGAVLGGLAAVAACVATPFGFALGLFALPLVGIGAFAGQAYASRGGAPVTYAADVAGGAAGALLAAPLLRSLGDVETALVALSAAGAALILVAPRLRVRLLGLLPSLAMAANVALPGGLLRVDPWATFGFVPHLVQQTRDRGGRVVETAWDGLVRTDLVVTDEPAIRYLFSDRKYTARIAGWDGRAAAFEDAQLRELARLKGLPFRALRPGRVLVLGAGGGFDVALALQAGAAHVDAVEINAAMIRMTQQQGDFAGRVYARPEVAVHHAEARRFVRESNAAWDLVSLALLQTDAAVDRGNTGFQSWIFTAESLGEALDRLAPRGVLAILQNTRAITEKTVATALAGYERRGFAATEAGRRMAILSLPQEGANPFAWLVVVGREPLAPDAVDALAREGRDVGATVVHAPGLPPGDSRFDALLSGTLPLRAWTAGQAARIEPATDERPFFFDLHRALPLVPLGAGGGAGVVLALLFARERAAGAARLTPRGFLAAGALGAGFLLAQSGLLARAQFLIGHPALAAAAVIGGMLAAAGLASLAADGRGTPAARLRVGGIAAAVLAVGSVAAWPLAREAARGLDTPALVALAAAMAALLGAPAGLAFPAALQAFGRGPAAAVFYGANAVAAVLGASLAGLLAPVGGLASLFGAAALLYAGASILAGGRTAGVDAVAPGLRRHVPADAREGRDLARILAFVERHPRPFDRRIAEGHLTGAAVIVSAGGDRVLLLHHRKLDRWLQPGGHGEAGEVAGESVALREALEETGIAGLALHPDAPRPFDVDVHPIPARGDEPAHEHLDLRYLVVAPPGAEARLNPDESHAIRWFGWAELDGLGLDPGLVRALAKARRVVERTP